MKKLWTFLLALLLCTPGFSGVRGAQAPDTYAILGDAGANNALATRLRASIQHFNESKLALPGDNLYDLSLSYEQIWNPWRQQGFSIPLVAIGNHTKGYLDEVRYFGLGGEYYAWSGKGYRFIVLNSDNVSTAAEQSAFLERELQAASEPLVYLMWHHPPYTLSPRHSWEERRGFHEKVRPILQRYSKKVSALILGHDHLASLLNFGDIPVLVSGASIETFPVQNSDYVEGGVRVRTVWAYNATLGQHWVRMQIDPSRQLTRFEFIAAATNQVTCTAEIQSQRIELSPICGSPR